MDYNMRTLIRLPITVLLLSALSISSLLAEESLRIGGTGAALGTINLLANAYSEINPDTSVEVLPSLGSGGGIKALIGGRIDIALSTRPASKEELDHG